MNAGTPPPELIARLRRLLVVNALITAVSVVFLLAVRLVFSDSNDIVVLAALVAATGVCMAAGLLPLRRGRIVAAVNCYAVANWVVALDVSAWAPFALPLMVTASLIPAAAAVPYVPARLLPRYVGTSVLVAFGCALLATTQNWSNVEGEMPDWVAEVTLVIFVPVMAALVAVIAFQSVAVVSHARDDALAARNEALDAQVRLVTAFDEARRSIERDLHDGAQQRLTAVAIGLGRAHSRAERDGLPIAAELAAVRNDLADARAELRRLAHGLYPSALAVHGLLLALRAEADRSVIPVSVRGRVPDDLPVPVAAAVYFCCLEAIHNVHVHAAGATRIDLEIGHDQGRLWFTVSDDGAGPVAMTAGGGTVDGAVTGGAGVTNMRDRLSAFGGGVVVEATDDGGTRVSGEARVTPASHDVDVVHSAPPGVLRPGRDTGR